MYVTACSTVTANNIHLIVIQRHPIPVSRRLVSYKRQPGSFPIYNSLFGHIVSELQKSKLPCLVSHHTAVTSQITVDSLPVNLTSQIKVVKSLNDHSDSTRIQVWPVNHCSEFSLEFYWCRFHCRNKAGMCLFIHKKEACSYNESQRDALFLKLFDKVLYMFRTSPPSIIRSISTLYSHNRYLSS